MKNRFMLQLRSAWTLTLRAFLVFIVFLLLNRAVNIGQSIASLLRIFPLYSPFAMPVARGVVQIAVYLFAFGFALFWMLKKSGEGGLTYGFYLKKTWGLHLAAATIYTVFSDLLFMPVASVVGIFIGGLFLNSLLALMILSFAWVAKSRFALEGEQKSVLLASALFVVILTVVQLLLSELQYSLSPDAFSLNFLSIMTPTQWSIPSLLVGLLLTVCEAFLISFFMAFVTRMVYNQTDTGI